MAINIKLLGQRISKERTNKNLTQEEFADSLHVSTKHLSNIEIGFRGPSIDLLVDIANTLEVSADDLLVDSLKHSSSTADTELHQLLLDCTEAEEQILIELVKFMKTVLYRQGI